MGYYTRFVIDAPDYVVDRLTEVSGYHFDDTCKWYEHENDIRTVSREYPTVLITVTGYGEEDGDIWRAYAINGEYQRVASEITFPPCTLRVPDKEVRKVFVTLGSVDIPVEVEVLTTANDKEAYAAAKELLKGLL